MKKRNENKQSTGEEGQALLLILLALSLVLCGAVGLAIDASQMYAQRQMAQAAADAAAQAAIVSVLNGTNNAANSNVFGTSGFNCTSSNTSLTPCYYAALDGFGPTYGDTVAVAFPTSVPRVVGLATDISPNLVSVTITRSVNTTLMQFLGSTAGSIVGHGTAAILLPTSGAPIIVTHPTLANAFQLGPMGSNTITITGGPSLSIQVNSCAGKGGSVSNGQSCQSGTSISVDTSNTIDLSGAGPSDNGGKFGNWGLPTTWSGNAAGHLLPTPTSTTYVSPSSIQADPLSGIAAPSQPTGAAVINFPTPTATNAAPNPCLVVLPPTAPNACQGASTWGCPAGTTNGCVLFYPGYYSSGISLPTTVKPHVAAAVFAPGLYYIGSGDSSSTGFSFSGNATASMATGFSPDSQTGTGMTVFLTGGAVVNLAGGANMTLTGDTVGTYGGMLFFKDRTDPCTAGSGVCTHSIPGGTGITLTGTIYLTRDSGATNTAYNVLQLAGSGGSTTNITGQIIVDTLQLGPKGNTTITINLPPSPAIRQVHQIALVQ